MDKLTTLLANKIIEISESSGDDLKPKLDKINRFREFTLAFQSLSSKYPQIEEEFIRMVEQNDFNTRTASARVDAIMRLAENSTNKDIGESESEFNQNTDDIVRSGYDTESEHNNEEDIEYTDFEEYEAPSEINNKETIVVSTEYESEPIETEQKQKIRLIIQIIGVLIAVIILIFIIKFVLNHWQTILYIVGGILALVLLICFLIKRSKKKR